MPGTKIDLTSGEDPDPSSFLFVSPEMKMKMANKPYDPKRSCYVPDQADKFTEGLIQETTGGKVKVQIIKSKEVKEYKQDLVTQVKWVVISTFTKLAPISSCFR